MNFHTITRELINLGFDGDIQASSDEIKDKAVYLCLSQFAPHELYEYFPAEIDHTKYMLDFLYEDPLWARHLWERQAHMSELVMGKDYTRDMGYWSEALAGQDENLYAARFDSDEFCRIITEAFYLHAEEALKDKLADAYTEITASDIYDASIALAEDKWREAV